MGDRPRCDRGSWSVRSGLGVDAIAAFRGVQCWIVVGAISGSRAVRWGSSSVRWRIVVGATTVNGLPTPNPARPSNPRPRLASSRSIPRRTTAHEWHGQQCPIAPPAAEHRPRSSPSNRTDHDPASHRRRFKIAPTTVPSIAPAMNIARTDRDPASHRPTSIDRTDDDPGSHRSHRMESRRPPTILAATTIHRRTGSIQLLVRDAVFLQLLQQ
jgi:hypothetical protein